MASTDVVIIGGGIAGLSVAYELRGHEVPFVVLEAGGRAGGVILSEEIDGYTIDAGPDSLLVQKPDGIRLCDELGLGAELVPTRPPRLAYVQRGGRLHPLPAASVLGIPTRIGPFLSTRLFSLKGKLRMAGELFVKPRRDAADESIGHAAIWRGSDDIPRRAAAGRHPRRRCPAVVRPVALSALRRGRTPARQRVAGVQEAASRAGGGRQRISIAAGRPEPDGSRIDMRAAARRRPAQHPCPASGPR
jgi:hypothetical protein